MYGRVIGQVLVLLGLVVIVVAQVTTSNGISCYGGVSCPQGMHCNEHNYKCEECEALCAKDPINCRMKCAGFHQSTTEQRLSALEANYATLRTWLIAATVALVLLALAVPCWIVMRNGLVSRFVSRLAKKKTENAPSASYTVENQNTRSPTARQKNGVPKVNNNSTVCSIYPETEADNSVQTVSTSLSRRHPAEDSTENYSFDNPALSVTPTSVKP